MDNALSTHAWTVEDKIKMTNEFLKKVKNIGTITITFRLCSPSRPKFFRSVELKCVDDLGIVPEKAMKGDAKAHKAS